MPALKEFDGVRTTRALAQADAYDTRRTHNLPAGQAGTVLEVWHGGEAYEVEFLLRGDDTAVLTLTADQVEPIQ